MPLQNTRLQHPLQVRIGIHTGLVVVGEMGGGGRHEQLALGDTPNIAARVQGIAKPDTVVISGATYRLVPGLFECQDLGPQESDTPGKAGGLMSGAASKAVTRVCHCGQHRRESQNVPPPSVSASSCSRI